MANFWYQAVDVFFVVFHLLFTLFNVIGWAWRKTRKLNMVTLLLTGFSWTILGMFYGFGYCPLTDWHWQALYNLGESGMPASYLEYLFERITGLEAQTSVVNLLTGLFFGVALLASLALNYRDYRRKKQTKNAL